MRKSMWLLLAVILVLGLYVGFMLYVQSSPPLSMEDERTGEVSLDTRSE